jgi:hypothetical protein
MYVCYRIMAALLAGALVSLAVATLSSWRPIPPEGDWSPATPMAVASHVVASRSVRVPGGVRISSLLTGTMLTPDQADETAERFRAQYQRFPDKMLLRTWWHGDFCRLVQLEGERDLLVVIHDARGWPLPVLTGSYLTHRLTDRGSGPPMVWHGCILLDESSPGEPFCRRLLPYRPIWINLILTSSLYGAVFYGLAMGAVALRQWRRRRGSRCLTCGYNCRGLPGAICPECGQPYRGPS